MGKGAMEVDVEAETGAELERNRLELLEQIEDWLETPMLVLGLVWLALLLVELVWGLSPILEEIGTVIWGIFIVDFVIRFALAPRKLRFLEQNVLTAVSLLLPALRVFRFARILRIARAARGLRLIKILGSLNRGMRVTRAVLRRRGLGYVLAFTLLVVTVGAGSMLAFERDVPGSTLQSYGEALWWTAMVVITVGTDYWPKSAEGRVLCLLFAVYGFTVFGFITASFASLFIDRDAASDEGEIAGAKAIQALEAEIRALRADLGTLPRTPPEAPDRR